AQHEIALPDIQFFSGTVGGEDDSRVFLALSPHGTSGTIFAGGHTSIISSGPQGIMPTVVYETDSALGRSINVQIPACQGALLAPGAELEMVEGAGQIGDRTGICRQYKIAVDADTEVTANLFGGNETNAAAYVATLIGGMNQVYQRDVNIVFVLSYLRLWVGPDPYDTANGSQLDQFRNYWETNMGSISRHMSHSVSARNLGGGVAWLSNICSSYAYASSGNMAGHFPYPLVHNSGQNWDMMVFAHESGHNLGTGHTHDSYNPIIDGCGNGDCTVAYQHLGTIMSYCHTCAGGMANVRMELGPRVSQVIRGFVDSRSSCGQVPSLAITRQPEEQTVCPGGTATFNMGLIGIGTRTYQWRRNGIAIIGERSQSLTITNADAYDAAGYDCVIWSAACLLNISDRATLHVCASDFNCDGAVDFFDYDEYVNAFQNGTTNADFDKDGTVDFFDYDAFVVAFQTPC
ncbi:MAG: M12 family metallo-peptidase, partial [Planctomycetota bacterium]